MAAADLKGPEESLGRSLAFLALAPIAERLADQREQEEEKAERQRQLGEALAKISELPRPSSPQKPVSTEFDFERAALTAFWLVPICLIWVGNWVSGKTVFTAGFPWIGMLALAAGLGALNGCWPLLRGLPVQERYRAEMRAYEAATAAADRRMAEREDVRRRS